MTQIEIQNPKLIGPNDYQKHGISPIKNQNPVLMSGKQFMG